MKKLYTVIEPGEVIPPGALVKYLDRFLVPTEQAGKIMDADHSLHVVPILAPAPVTPEEADAAFEGWFGDGEGRQITTASRKEGWHAAITWLQSRQPQGAGSADMMTRRKAEYMAQTAYESGCSFRHSELEAENARLREALTGLRNAFRFVWNMRPGKPSLKDGDCAEFDAAQTALSGAQAGAEVAGRYLPKKDEWCQCRYENGPWSKPYASQEITAGPPLGIEYRPYDVAGHEELATASTPEPEAKEPSAQPALGNASSPAAELAALRILIEHHGKGLELPPEPAPTGPEIQPAPGDAREAFEGWFNANYEPFTLGGAKAKIAYETFLAGAQWAQGAATAPAASGKGGEA